jgi:ubiquitin C-terminal hydrolase
MWSLPFVECACGETVSYNVTAITEHIDLLEFGYYVASVRDEGDWYRYSDQEVEEVDHDLVFGA